MPQMTDRRSFHRALLGGALGLTAGAGAGLGAALWPAAARAQYRVEIAGIGANQLPVAVAAFRGEEQLAQPVAPVLRADLVRSGVFRLIDAPGVLDENSTPVIADWRGRGADALVLGSATRLADGRVDVRYKLWDVVKGEDLGGQSLVVPAADLRLAAHRIADTLQKRLTGEAGVNATRIAYVTKSGGRYQLHIADADGLGDQIALASPQPIISPAWSPDGRRLAYVSFERGKAVVMVQNVADGQRRAVAAWRGSNSAPTWSPDGKRLVVTLSKDGPSQLYMLDLDTDGVRRFSFSNAIDTEATFSPDGRWVYFVSDRSGGPQIYRKRADDFAAEGGQAERITFSGSYNISPSISPDGRWLAYVNRNGGFRTMLMPLDGSGAVQAVGDTSDDESPSFAPNSRLLLYATRAKGRDVLMTSTLDGSVRTPLLVTGADVREPAWGPYTP